MASGTQGYEAAQSGVIEKIIERFKNRKKDDEGNDNSVPTDKPGSQPDSPTSPTPTSSMLIQGATVNQLMSASPGLAKPPINITEYGEDRVLQAILIEQQKTNQILTAQNQILAFPCCTCQLYIYEAKCQSKEKDKQQLHQTQLEA